MAGVGLLCCVICQGKSAAGFFNHLFEILKAVNGHFGKHLAVDADVSFFKIVHEPGIIVFGVDLFDGGADAGNP